MYGESIFYEEAINDIIPDAYVFAIKEKELKVVAQPMIENADVTDDKSLSLVIVAALYPEVTLGEYKGIEAVRNEIIVDAYEVDAEIEALRNRNSSLVTCDREAKYGDIVVIDYEGFLDGVPFEGGKGEKHSLEIGSNSFIPGFETQCIGAKADEEREINVVFPENYNAEELRGKAAVFKIKVHEVREKLLPELDDEFAKDVSEYDTLEEYRQSIHDNILNRKTEAVKNDFLDAVLSKIVDNMTVELPDAMVGERTERMISDYAQRLSNQGMSLDMYLELFKIEPATFENSTRITAERQLKSELALMKISELEGIEVTQEDKEAEYEKLAKTYGVDAESVKTFFDEEVLAESILMNKTADFVIENAVPMPEPEEEAPEQEPSGEGNSEPETDEAETNEAETKPEQE
jgi:trigger factor